MKKRVLIVIAIVLAVVACLYSFVGCDGASNYVKHLTSYDFNGDCCVNITMRRRLRKTFSISVDEISIKFEGSLSELYEQMQLEDGFTKTFYDDYFLIETAVDGKVYTWGVFDSSVFGDEYLGSYQYVLTNMAIVVPTVAYYPFFFPIYTMERPLLVWEENERHACSLTVDELSDFYTRQGYETVISDNILTVTTPTKKDYEGNDRSKSWEITFHYDGTVSVGNFLTSETIYD